MLIRELSIKRTPSISKTLWVDNGLSYAGVGSRSTPLEIGEVMIRWAYYHALEGFNLRSGGAEQADTYFEIGVDLAIETKGIGSKQIFLSKKLFGEHNSPWYIGNRDLFTEEQEAWLNKELMLVGGLFHKGLATMKENEQQLMLRNGQQVLGPLLNDPSMAIIAWTPDAAINHEERTRMTGGTGQAISIASCEYLTIGSGESRYIKDEPQQILNLRRKDHLDLVLKRISQLEIKHGKMPEWKKELNWKPILQNRLVKKF